MKHIESIQHEELGSQVVDIITSSSLRESIVTDATQGTMTETTMNEELQAAVVGAVRKIGNHTKQLNIAQNGEYQVTPDHGTLLKAVDVHVDATNSVLVDYVNKGGKFARTNANNIPIVWEDITGNDLNYLLEEGVCSVEIAQRLLNLLTDDKEYQEYMDGVDFTNVGSEVYWRFPDGFKNSKNLIIISANNNLNAHVTLDCNDLEYTGTLFGWTSIRRLTLLNTKQLKDFYNPTSSIAIDAFDCDGLIRTPWREGIYNNTTTLGGFINLGKGFLQNGRAAYHTMMFDSWMQNLSHDSLVNIFNGLYDLNLHTFQFTNQPTIQLGATNYSRVSAAEIKIATDKGWIVTK
jgi:hypothetical protein